MTHKFVVKIAVDDAPIRRAIRSLEELSERFPEVVQRFLNGVDSATQIVRLHRDDASTAGTGEIRIFLQPSDFLRDFLAAAGARDVD